MATAPGFVKGYPADGSQDVQATCPCANSQSRYNDDLRWQKGLYPEDKVEALETEKGCWGIWEVPVPARG